MDIVRSRWKLQRVQRAHHARLTAGFNKAGRRKDEKVARRMERLFWDARGPNCMFGGSSVTRGGPSTSWPGEVNGRNKPAKLVRRLEATMEGCRALIAEWRGLGVRIEKPFRWQSLDRLKAIRMLGKQPIDAAEDQGIAHIFIASFAIDPIPGRNAYSDLQSDLGPLELKEFKMRVRTRWPQALEASNVAAAEAFLRDLVARNIARLEALIEEHEDLADEQEERDAELLGYDESPEGDRLRRYELACERAVARCQTNFWKHRKETAGRTEGGGRRAEEIREEEAVGGDAGLGRKLVGRRCGSKPGPGRKRKLDDRSQFGGGCVGSHDGAGGWNH